MGGIESYFSGGLNWWGHVGWPWLGGPLWTLMNSNFISGLIPAIVGVVLARRVAEVAESNKSVEAVRSAEAEISDIDRTEDTLELTNRIQTPEPQPTMPSELAPTAAASTGAPAEEPLRLADVEALEGKIESIKAILEKRIAGLDGRRRRK